MDQKLSLLRKVPLLSGLGSRELEEVSRLVDEIDVPAGQVLMREGQTGNEFFLIVEGRVRIERDGRQIGELGAGDFLGEIALVDDGPRSATATCETACRLFVIAHREFHSLLERFPKVQSSVLRVLAQRVRRLEPESAN